MYKMQILLCVCNFHRYLHACNEKKLKNCVNKTKEEDDFVWKQESLSFGHGGKVCVIRKRSYVCCDCVLKAYSYKCSTPSCSGYICMPWSGPFWERLFLQLQLPLLLPLIADDDEDHLLQQCHRYQHHLLLHQQHLDDMGSPALLKKCQWGCLWGKQCNYCC